MPDAWMERSLKSIQIIMSLIIRSFQRLLFMQDTGIIDDLMITSEHSSIGHHYLKHPSELLIARSCQSDTLIYVCKH